ncbi:MAG: profilin, required for normal timing of actin polymerization in response to thermal stress [Vezdaea acicularis]|nr:MAG: profilin, required for normal timing of actin polymerization in response to thermal stress [Vezdaea acicularis]
MSWQAYVDTSLLGTGQIDHAAIFSADGHNVWAISPSFPVEASETKNLVAGFTKPETIIEGGFHVAKVKYITLRADDRSIYGKQGKEGVICVKTKQCILIAHYPDTVQPGAATNIVEQLADYLIKQGY